MRAIHRMDAAKNTKNQEYPIILLLLVVGQIVQQITIQHIQFLR